MQEVSKLEEAEVLQVANARGKTFSVRELCAVYPTCLPSLHHVNSGSTLVTIVDAALEVQSHGKRRRLSIRTNT